MDEVNEMRNFDEERLERERILRMIPTEMVDALSVFVGKKIKELYSLYYRTPEEKMDSYWSRFPYEGIKLCDSFSLNADFLSIVFSDDSCISLTVEEEIISVLISVGNAQELVWGRGLASVIPSDDPVYSTRDWVGVPGKVIAGFSVVYRKDMYPGCQARPFECGIAIHLTDGSEFFYGDNIHKTNSSPSVFFEKDLLDRDKLVIERLV
ncbi:hypothetical protein [Insolitispirillum peregrinum]|uniref:hypothetical protein n=1 Tax=Insolitispirillum peregrinum TaxID=80876 RepID=UPI003607AF5C